MQTVRSRGPHSFGDVGPKYVDCSIHGPHPSSWAQANGTGPRFCQRVYKESNYFSTYDLVDACKNHLHYEVVRSFLLESRGLQRLQRRRHSSLTQEPKGWLSFNTHCLRWIL